jgi:GMP synthase (glutamine-hydrolysing)
MRIHVLQHAAFESPANIEVWAREKGFTVTKTFFFDEPVKVPTIDSFDFLVVMGGPMGVNDDQKFPWLKVERKLIEDALSSKKKILGVSLGAQLVAQALGAQVFANKHKEIGWYPVEAVSGTGLFKDEIPSPLLVFHWHGDTFSLPSGAEHFMRSPLCENQAFIWSDNVLALQFHLEVQPENVRDFVAHCRKELSEGGPFVQRAESILAESGKALALRPVMERVLESFLTASVLSKLA